MFKCLRDGRNDDQGEGGERQGKVLEDGLQGAGERLEFGKSMNQLSCDFFYCLNDSETDNFSLLGFRTGDLA